MPALDAETDVFSPRFLSSNGPGPAAAPRRLPSRQSLAPTPRKSSASLRSGTPSSLADAFGSSNGSSGGPDSADDASGRHSLAHELAAALLPEPSAGSKLLAEEFGIEYDEGAEGIDDAPDAHSHAHMMNGGALGNGVADEEEEEEMSGARTPQQAQYNEYDGLPAFGGAESLAAQLDGAHAHSHPHSRSSPSPLMSGAPEIDPEFGSPHTSPTRPRRLQPEQQDPMAVLAADLEYTEKFLAHLRRLDASDGPSASPVSSTFPSTSTSTSKSASASTPASTSTSASALRLERLASDVIRRINDAAREREDQLRELLECEREFRKIAGEAGGPAALAGLPALEDLVSDSVPDPAVSPTASASAAGPSTTSSRVAHTQERDLDAIAEDANDWEVDPDRARLGDEQGGEDEDDEDAYARSPYSPTAPTHPSALAAPSSPTTASSTRSSRRHALPTDPTDHDPIDPDDAPIPTSTSTPTGPPTPATALRALAHLRTSTAGAARALAGISEHTQVTAAAAAEAGRRIRALKNKLGGWRAEWDGAERSRVRIERWEAGVLEGDGEGGVGATASGAMSPPRAQRRVDGRKVVKEHMDAFERALGEANTKTQAIIAAVS